MAIPSAQQPVYLGNNVFDVSRWSGNWTARLAEVTTSAHNGGTRGAPVATHPQWRLEVPLDDPAFVELVGLTPGAEIAVIYFKHSSKADKIVNTRVASVEKSTDSSQDVPRVVVTGEYGTLTYNVVPGTG